MLYGKHYVAGSWIDHDDTFENMPTEGTAQTFAVGTQSDIDQACQAAEEAFIAYNQITRQDRARFLETIADEIEARGQDITDIGIKETGLPAPRLENERGRTANQIRLFARHILEGSYLDRRHDAALPDREPLPRPDLRMMQRPIGPVAVFGASNFPLAFSVAGGDTASALAAGCPVVVKGHSAHPGISEVVAQSIAAAIKKTGMPKGVFSLIQGGDRTVGQALVEHPLIRAVGFTGSLAGGRALFDLCAARPDPIPFFGELGSVNPVFIMPDALRNRATEIAQDWAGSLTLGAGQFCTNPGIVILPNGPDAEAFTTAAKSALEDVGSQTMLTEGIASAYYGGRNQLAAVDGVKPVLRSQDAPRGVTPDLFEVDAETWLENDILAEEVFGPLGVIVHIKNPEQMMAIARSLKGQLTCTIQLDEADTEAAGPLLTVLERKAGRLIANGFPTGVEVCDAMVHGGPYPASTNFGATSVGTLSIRRWLRPVCFQNIPDALLPTDLKG